MVHEFPMVSLPVLGGWDLSARAWEGPPRTEKGWMVQSVPRVVLEEMETWERRVVRAEMVTLGPMRQKAPTVAVGWMRGREEGWMREEGWIRGVG